jgi:hypothetical protein
MFAIGKIVPKYFGFDDAKLGILPDQLWYQLTSMHLVIYKG